MTTNTLESILWLSALVAAVHGMSSRLVGELDDLSEEMLERWRPLAMA
jgi:hypothetical protein